MNLNISINNFKSISSTSLNLKGGVNILIGPNGSGKTCLLTSLKFVRDLFRYGAAQALARNGGARRVYRRGTNMISFSIKHDYGERTYRLRKVPCQISWEIKISQSGREKIATIVFEDLSIFMEIDGKNRLLFQYTVDRSKFPSVKTRMNLCEPNIFGRDLFSSWDDFFPRDSKRKIYEIFKERVSRDFLRSARAHPDQSIFPQVAGLDMNLLNLYSLFMYLNEYSLVPDIARQSSEQLPFAQMQPNGAGVSEVVLALEKKNFDRVLLATYYMEDTGEDEFLRPSPFRYRYSRYYREPYRYPLRYRSVRRERKALESALENINSELSTAVKPIESVTVQTDQSNGRRFVMFRAGEDTFYPEEVSDGTIKWLCILVSIFVPYSEVYLLEEPENFLHPWMQQRLVEMMRERAKLSETIFILASHSSTILNSAFPEEVLVVSATDSGTKVHVIENREEIEQVLSKSNFRLGDYWISGALGGVP